jgi:site-specific DNA-methyltransferase (adenine-specific)
MIEAINADALETLLGWDGERRFDLVITDPPYSFSGQGAEHEMTATVAVALREAAGLLKPGCWMLAMCASSWRSQAYIVEAVRGLLVPVRTLTWCKPEARTKTRTAGPLWASVSVVVFRKGKSERTWPSSLELDHITAAPVKNGRRAELPPEVADWMVRPYAVPGGMLLDPFAGSGAIVRAAERAGMHGVGIEQGVGLPRIAVVTGADESSLENGK